MLTVKASRLWANAWAPASLTVQDNGIVTVNPGATGLFPVTREIPWKKVASVKLERGVFVSRVTIESTGGAKAVVEALPHSEAARAVALIRERMQTAQGSN